MDSTVLHLYNLAHNPWHAEVYQNNVQSIASGSFVQVAFDSIEADPNSSFTTGASAKYTCPVTGRYLVNCTVGFQTSTAAGYALAVFKNGAEAKRLFSLGEATGTTVQEWVMGTAIVPAVAGDTLDLRAFQTTGAAINTYIGASGNATFASFTWLGP